VELEPRDASYRVTLGQVYLAAGLHLNARREIEVAASLAPDDVNIAKLVKAVRRGN
jgi:Flp pilus assembly protein TadD